MVHLFHSLVLLGLAGQPLFQDLQDRPRHLLAPSLPQLTPAEEKYIEKVLQRFILYDTGKLGGAEGKKALADFNRLGPEAIFGLIDGFNDAANLESSCPAVIIGKKIASILGASEDPELLTFARESLGAGVKAKRHLGVVKDLKVGAMLRRTYVQKKIAAVGKSPAIMSVKELSASALKDKGDTLRLVLIEAEKRQGPEVFTILAIAASHSETEIQKTAKNLLGKHAARQPPDTLKKLLKHEQPEVRLAAVHAIAARKLPYGSELIDLLGENYPEIQQAARKALVQLSGLDHGPEPNAAAAEVTRAVEGWRTWWKTRQQ